MNFCNFLLVYTLLLSGAPFLGPTPFFAFGDGDHAHGADHGHGSVTTVHSTGANGESATTSTGTSNSNSGPGGLGAGGISGILSSLSPELISSLAQNPAVSSGIDLGSVTAGKAAAEASGTTSPPSAGGGGGAYNYPPTPGGPGGFPGDFGGGILFSGKFRPSLGTSSSGTGGLGAGEVAQISSSPSPELISSLAQNPAVSSYRRNNGNHLGLATEAKAAAEAGGITSSPTGGSGNYKHLPQLGGPGGFLGAVDAGLSLLGTAEPDVRFFLFKDCLHPGKFMELFHNNLPAVGKIEPQFETKIIIHGFLSTKKSAMPSTIKNALLKTGQNENIIVVDWSRHSYGYLIPDVFNRRNYPFYSQSVRNLHDVATATYNFIRFLIGKASVRCETIQLLGHSLGARISAEIARQLYTDTKTPYCKLKEIVLMDPAGPEFDDKYKAVAIPAIRTDTASCVLLIYSDNKYFGTTIDNQGTVNIKVNAGFSQSCPWWRIPCSHSVAYQFYAMTIIKDGKTCEKIWDINCLQPSGDETSCETIRRKRDVSQSIIVEFDIDREVNAAIMKQKCSETHEGRKAELADELTDQRDDVCTIHQQFF